MSGKTTELPGTSHAHRRGYLHNVLTNSNSVYPYIREARHDAMMRQNAQRLAACLASREDFSDGYDAKGYPVRHS